MCPLFLEGVGSNVTYSFFLKKYPLLFSLLLLLYRVGVLLTSSVSTDDVLAFERILVEVCDFLAFGDQDDGLCVYTCVYVCVHACVI